MLILGDLERLDARLASLAQAETGLRLRLGQVLEVLGRGKHFELGFSSVAAYALERCDRSVRWVEAARCLARRLEALPELRRAMALGEASGGVSWSMGELLARVAQPPDEASWIELARSRTVRQMRVLVLEATADDRAVGGVVLKGHSVSAVAASAGAASAGAAPAGAASAGAASAGENAEDEGGEEMCTLTCTVDREEGWLFEATRALLSQLGERSVDAQIEGLLAEGQGSLLAALPPGALDLDRLESADTAAQQRWLQELSRWRAEAEARCEGHFLGSVLAARAAASSAGAGERCGFAEWNGTSERVQGAVAVAAALGGAALEGAVAAPERVQGAVAVAAALGGASLEGAGCRELDAVVRGLSRALANHELELSRRILSLHRADGWRRLGYASETQYARERLGMSRSSMAARRALALRLEKLPMVAHALGAGQIGVEAALQVVRVATPTTQVAWVARAQQRTIKHLREEVAAALVAVRVSGEAHCPPPVEVEMAAFQQLEQAVVSGTVCQPRPANDSHVERDLDRVRLAEPASEERRAWLVMLGSLGKWLEGGLQMSAAGGRAAASSAASRIGSSAGRITLRLRVTRATCVWWRGLEAQARRWLPCGMSFLSFLCLSMWQAWRHLLGPDVAYGQIYIRDRHRCTSPVCSRKDVTPHHLQFRSAGGSDKPANITSLCLWCQLCGVHGGRIRAAGSAELIHWELGPPRSPCLVVHGRERVAA